MFFVCFCFALGRGGIYFCKDGNIHLHMSRTYCYDPCKIMSLIPSNKQPTSTVLGSWLTQCLLRKGWFLNLYKTPSPIWALLFSLKMTWHCLARVRHTSGSDLRDQRNAYGHSQAGVKLELHLQSTPQSPPRRILNPLSRARDRTCILIETAQDFQNENFSEKKTQTTSLRTRKARTNLFRLPKNMEEGFLFLFCFLGPHVWHMEGSRLWWNWSCCCAYATAHSDTRSLTHWVRP